MTDISVMGEWQVVGVGGTRPLWECFGRGYRGTIFVRSSKLSLFFPELCPFRRVFLFPALLKDLAPNVSSSGAFGFDDVLGLILKTPLRHWAFFCELLLRPQEFLENFLSFFQSRAGFTCLTAIAIPSLSKALWWWYVENQNESSTSGRWRDRVQKDHRSSSRLVQSCAMIHGPEEKRKKHKEVSVWLCEGSTLHHLQTQRVLRSLFPRPDVATVSHFAVFVDADVPLQDGQAAARGQRRKAVTRDISGVDHRGVTNLSAPIWFTGQRHCTVLRYVMQLSLLVLCWKSTLTVILPHDQEKNITFKRWPPGYQSWKLGLALNGLSFHPGLPKLPCILYSTFFPSCYFEWSHLVSRLHFNYAILVIPVDVFFVLLPVSLMTVKFVPCRNQEMSDCGVTSSDHRGDALSRENRPTAFRWACPSH